MKTIGVIAKKLEVDEPTLDRVRNYLLWYGYLPVGIQSESMSSESASAIISWAVSKLQRVAGIPENGEIDQATLELMNRPRCGVPDILPMVIAEAKWRKTQLTYFIESYVNGISKSTQEELLRLAFKSWVDLCGISIERAGSQARADLISSTGKGRAQGFDGPGGTLAYAYLPNGSDRQLPMLFDLDEPWTDDPKRDIFYLAVAAHEIGHLFGLDHSRKSGALMAPFYRNGLWLPQPDDDVSRIQSLYGVEEPSPPPDPEPPSSKRLKIEQVIDLANGSQESFSSVHL